MLEVVFGTCDAYDFGCAKSAERASSALLVEGSQLRCRARRMGKRRGELFSGRFGGWRPVMEAKRALEELMEMAKAAF